MLAHITLCNTDVTLGEYSFNISDFLLKVSPDNVYTESKSANLMPGMKSFSAVILAYVPVPTTTRVIPSFAFLFISVCNANGRVYVLL